MRSQHPIRILSVEDHPAVREGLAMIIDSQEDMLLAAQAADATEAIKEFRSHRPDVTLMDLRLPGASGIDAMIAIRGEYPDARIMVLTTSDGDVEIQRALRAGAAAYVLKSTPKNELLKMIRSVHAGIRQVPADAAVRLAGHVGDGDLTQREVDVLCLIRDGFENKEIAGQSGNCRDHGQLPYQESREQAASERQEACSRDRDPARPA